MSMSWPPALLDVEMSAILIFISGGLICGFYLFSCLLKNILQHLPQGLWVFGFGFGVLALGLGFFLRLCAYWGFVCIAASLGCWWMTMFAHIAESRSKKRNAEPVYPSQPSEGVWPPPIRWRELFLGHDDHDDDTMS